MFFRREYTELTDVVDRGDQIAAPLGVKFNHQRRRWEFGNKFVQLGAIDQPDDVQKYQGRARDLYVFDEVSFFMEARVRYITGWLRSTDPGQRTRVLMMGNPPTTPEGEWIVQYFAPWLDEKHPNPAQPGELRWFAVLDDKSIEVNGPDPILHKGEMIQPKSRTFIPAYLSDNPFLRDTAYRATLQGLPDELKQKFLDGKFNVKTPDKPWQVIPTAWVEAAQERWKQGRRPAAALRCCGLDVSRGGDDKTVLARLYHEWFEIDVWEGKAVPDGDVAADNAISAIVDDAPAPFFVDVIGIGASAYDSLKRREGLSAIPVNVAEASDAVDETGKFPFANLRSQLHWQFREALKPNSPHAIALPLDRRVKTDLCAATYRITKSGIQVESKEDIKKRLGFSPDYGDAILLAWYGAQHSGPFFDFV
jgi:hypothetical protein